ncbi:glycoside hydrolase family 18 protein, partial sequence [Botrytis cinerea T4]|uniref:chitinase n=1 Tax=Botryotinia fuckeliana (strain T4) TaxID=999810 RepID=G2XP48_BOTF4
MPIYGRSFEKTNGIGQSFQGVGQGTWESGVYDYKVLPLLGATEVYDESIGASYSWDISKREIISYDNPLVAVQKGKWIRSMNLGGAMWWESSADGRGSRSLIGSVMSVLGSRIQNVTNQLSYPNSTYTNVKDGMPEFSSLPSASISNSTIYNSGAHSSSSLDITSIVLGTTIAKSSSEVRTTIDSSCSGNAAINSYGGTTTTVEISLPGNTATTTVSTSFPGTTPSNPSSGIVTPLRNSSSHITTVSSLLGTATSLHSFSVANDCSLVTSCSIITTVYSYSVSTPMTSTETTSISFPISTNSATICICNNCYFGVNYAVSGTSTTTFCGNIKTIPTGFTRTTKGKAHIYTTTTTTTLPVPSKRTTTSIITTTISSEKRSSECNPNLECYTRSTTTVPLGFSPTNVVCAMDTNNDPNVLKKKYVSLTAVLVLGMTRNAHLGIVQN